MNSYLTKLGQQLLMIWKQLGVNQRISVSLATLVLLAGMVGMLVWSSRVEQALL